LGVFGVGVDAEGGGKGGKQSLDFFGEGFGVSSPPVRADFEVGFWADAKKSLFELGLGVFWGEVVDKKFGDVGGQQWAGFDWAGVFSVVVCEVVLSGVDVFGPKP
jgi:hypothetical protein